MQTTLAEVELSAANGSHIFGAGHAKALEELRAAQLELAKAWARSERDEVGSHGVRDDEEGEGDRGKEKEEERESRLMLTLGRFLTIYLGSLCNLPSSLEMVVGRHHDGSVSRQSTNTPSAVCSGPLKHPYPHV